MTSTRHRGDVLGVSLEVGRGTGLTAAREMRNLSVTPLLAPGAVKPARHDSYQVKKFGQAASIRHPDPATIAYRPQFFPRTADVSGVIDLGGVPMVMPGDTVELTVHLGKEVPMDIGLGFVVREGGQEHGNRVVAVSAAGALSRSTNFKEVGSTPPAGAPADPPGSISPCWKSPCLLGAPRGRENSGRTGVCSPNRYEQSSCTARAA
jgi:hypothetical protein